MGELRQNLYDHAEGNLSVEVEDVLLRDLEGTEVARGKGKIKLNDDKNPILHLHDVESYVDDFMLRMSAGRNHGNIPYSKKMEGYGVTISGIKFETGPLDITQIGSSGLILNAPWVKFVNQKSSIQYCRTTLLSFSKPFLPPSPDSRQRPLGNPKETIQYYYGSLNFGQEVHELRSFRSSQFLVTNSSSSTHEQFDRGIVLAMSFVGGKKVWRLAVLEESQNEILTLFRAPRISGGIFFSPTRYFLNNASGYEMITCLTELFKEDSAADIRTLVEVFLLVPHFIEWSGRTLVVSAIIEGLIGNLLKFHSVDQPKLEEFDKAKEALLAYTSTLSRFSTETLNRWRGIISNSASYNLEGKLRLLSNYLKIKIEDTEKVFVKIRGKSAHGTFANPFEDNYEKAYKSQDELSYITNLFNKILLAGAGYKGDFCDYSVGGGRISKVVNS
jgi:hypothetical protein